MRAIVAAALSSFLLGCGDSASTKHGQHQQKTEAKRIDGGGSKASPNSPPEPASVKSNSGKANQAPEPQPKKTPAKTKKIKPIEKDGRYDKNILQTHQGVRVAVHQPEIDHVYYYDRFSKTGESKTIKKYLIIPVQVFYDEGKGPGRYSPWNISHDLKLIGNDGKVYDHYAHPQAVGVQTKAMAFSRPGRDFDWVYDLIAFDSPAEGVESVRLELPASNIQKTGTIVFDIPASMIKRK